MFKLSENIDPNKVFIVNRSELEGRIDPEMILYSMKNVDNFKYPYIQLKKMLLKSPQYGANEASVIRINNEQPRYIRITDIDENGTLRKELGATAETIDSKYILNNNDILFARSGATVGKTYIHKVKKINYKAFFAGYMIRFIVNPDIIIPDFLFIYTQLSVYKKWVKATQRAAGQPNINAEEYKSLKIPLPPLEIQQQIVDLYEKAYTEKQQKEAEAQKLLDSIDDYFLGELGITLPKEEELLPQNTDKNTSYNLDNDNPLVKKGRLFLTNLSEITGKRIDPDYNSKMTYLFSNKGFYNHILLKELITKQPQYGANEEAKDFENDTDIRYIRITDIDELGDLKNNNKKTANKVETKYFLNYNDLLFARSGSVGRCYIHKKTNEMAIFAGYLIRFVVNTDICNPDYIFYYCNSKFYKLWVSAIERPAVQSNINAEEYKSLPIPLPSLEKQNEIATHISQIRNKANALKQEGKDFLEQAKQEVERMILGN
jgi:type II restriction-modification enzyme